jgi:hypothetical protein
MLKVSLLIILSINLGGCISKGLKEPVVEFCTIVDGQIAYCETPFGQNPPRDITTVDMIGYTCVSPKDFAAAESHHDILHRELNKKSSK